MSITKKVFDQHNGIAVNAFTFTSETGIAIEIIEYGGIITKIITPDKNGNPANIVIGKDTVYEYEKDESYFGAICGRTGGRITNAQFTLDNQVYKLSKNDGSSHLHGGKTGFNKVIWKGEIQDENSVAFRYTSPDGEEGYPGELITTVTYTLESNALIIDYRATSDKTTIVNLTNHSYFNLSGDFNQTILDHHLKIPASKVCELNPDLTPTGKLLDVGGTPFDFTEGKLIAEAVENMGIDNPFLFDSAEDTILYHSQTGRRMTITTDAPGIVIYTGNFLQNKHTALCLETQGLPDAINHPNFPPVVLKAGDTYRSRSVYTFGISD